MTTKKKKVIKKWWVVLVEGEGDVRWDFLSAHPLLEIAIDERRVWKENGIKTKVIPCTIHYEA